MNQPVTMVLNAWSGGCAEGDCVQGALEKRKQIVPPIRRIIADADMDGAIAAAVVLASAPGADLIFTRASQVRAGMWDDLIDANTAIVDLPFRPGCGLYIDHHESNAPTPAQRRTAEAAGSVCLWEAAPSAARVAWDRLGGLPALSALMPLVDAIDSGRLDRETFLADGPLLCLARQMTIHEPALLHAVARHLAAGGTVETLLALPVVCDAINAARKDRAAMAALRERVTITDRFAIARFEGTGLKPNGYLISAWVGDAADAVCVIHGSSRAPGASFYTNSFLHGADGIFNLLTLAQALDETGGGHRGACGCRVHPISADPISDNLAIWLNLWGRRQRQAA